MQQAFRSSRLVAGNKERRMLRTDLRCELSLPPDRVRPAEAAEQALRLDPGGHDLDAHVAPVVFDDDAAAVGLVLQAQHA
jgi:hypothetical protein